MIAKDQKFWLHKLSTLRIDRARGNPAPHKPLLLLVVLEMMEKGEIKTRELNLSPDLAFQFSIFWSVVSSRRSQPPDVRLPFHHLESSGIWEPLTAEGSPSLDKKLTTRVRFDPGFFDCIADFRFRDRAKRLLIETKPYFHPEEKTSLYSLLKIKPVSSEIRENQALYKTSIQKGRDARFRLDVVQAYQHTCALTGYRCTTLNMESIVDVAHIHEFKDSRNNDPRNGMALSKNAHWQFDRGLWSLNKDYRVLINKEKFTENGMEGLRMTDFEGRKIFLPTDSIYWPDYSYLDWHRKRHGFTNQ
ncbi:MAG: HNH endonuclease [Desulfobacterales bacterium]|jgi:putative restriction endonuclease|nr:HNH endonuclease [Desulfobacterales bacterium]